MSGPVVRPARSDEAPDIVELVRGGFEPSVLECTIYGCHGVANYVARQLSLPPSLASTVYFVAELRGALVGCIEMRRDEGQLFPNYISVQRSFRHRGIGSLLFGRALELATLASSREVQLDVFTGNAVALNWYEGLGFERVSTSQWWDITPRTPEAPLGPPAMVLGFPQAELCHQSFGFSQVEVVAGNRVFPVGRLGSKWFRVTGPDALLVPAFKAALRRLDRRRHVLLLAQEDTLPPGVTGTPVIRCARLAVGLDRLMRTVGDRASSVG